MKILFAFCLAVSSLVAFAPSAIAQMSAATPMKSPMAMSSMKPKKSMKKMTASPKPSFTPQGPHMSPTP